MLFEIKIRLIKLGKKQKDLIPELENRIVELSNEIIKEWEVK